MSFVKHAVCRLDGGVEKHREQLVDKVRSDEHAEIVDSVERSIDVPRSCGKDEILHYGVENLDHVKSALFAFVCGVVRRHCVGVCAQRDAESVEQVEHIHLHLRSADAFKVNEHDAVHKIDVHFDFTVRAVLVGEIEAYSRFETFENGLDVKVEIGKVDARKIAHSDCVKVEFCIDVEFEAVVNHVGKHEAESKTFEQIAHAESVLLHREGNFFVGGVYADLREHRPHNALKLFHIEKDFDQIVEGETVAHVVPFVVLDESVVVCVLGVSVLG